MASTFDNDGPISESFMDHFSCKICLEILNNPVQCQRNEHYFCTLCITKHLEQSQTCPLCMEELTTETLRPASRMLVAVLSEFRIPRCKYVHRGCEEVIKVQDLAFHHEVCGFAPVVCSNEGCGETVNRKDQASHQNESCKFRKTKCEVCNEGMVYRDYEMHRCFMRKEIDEIKLCMTEMRVSLEEMREEVKTFNQFIRDSQDPLRNVTPSSLIFVAGGGDKEIQNTFEIFNWSTKTWTLYKDVLFFNHYYSFSFPYKNFIMVCGGNYTNRIEYLNIKEDPTTSSAFPISLPELRSYSKRGKGVIYGYRLLTFDDSRVYEVVLESPRSSKTRTDFGKCKQYFGAECVNQGVVIVGGDCMTGEGRWEKSLNTVLHYDPRTNVMKKLAPLPYGVSKMATVPYKDSIIILGGEDGYGSTLNSVLMYNISSEESKRLPSMLKKRSGCAAVIMRDVIVVMGGRSFINNEPTVEYHVLGQDCWNELPSMHYAREGATASVQM